MNVLCTFIYVECICMQALHLIILQNEEKVTMFTNE